MKHLLTIDTLTTTEYFPMINPAQLRFLSDNGLLLYTPKLHRETNYSVNYYTNQQFEKLEESAEPKEETIKKLTKSTIDGKPKTISLILYRHPQLKNYANNKKNNLMHFAAASGNVELICTLQNAGIDLQARNHIKNKPLHIAIATGSVPAVQCILEKSIKNEIVDSIDSNGCNILHLAAISGSKDMLDYITKTIIQTNGQDRLNEMLNTTNNNEQTPLHLATLSNSTSAVTMLLQHDGILLDKQDSNNDTALHLASRLNNLQNFTALEKRGADLHLKNNQNDNAIKPLPPTMISNCQSYFVYNDPFQYHFQSNPFGFSNGIFI